MRTDAPVARHRERCKREAILHPRPWHAIAKERQRPKPPTAHTPPAIKGCFVVPPRSDVGVRLQRHRPYSPIAYRGRSGSLNILRGPRTMPHPACCSAVLAARSYLRPSAFTPSTEKEASPLLSVPCSNPGGQTMRVGTCQHSQKERRKRSASRKSWRSSAERMSANHKGLMAPWSP